MYAIIDIETTGNGVKGNKITEIAIFLFDGKKIVNEFTSLVNPQCPIPRFITGLTGIDDDTVKNAPTFSEIAEQVLAFTQDCIFVAHAVNFDYGVIKEEFRQLNISFARKKLCTVRLARKLIPGMPSYSLGKLCSSLGIPLTDRHRARGDAAATVRLMQYMLQKPGAEPTITTFLNARSQEATLPPHLDRKLLDALPYQPGIYYFLDKHKTIIYVGKAKNLKKRVLGHFYDKSEHEIKLCREVAHIDFELSGSELIALLMESAAIKKHYPKFNRAQKRTPPSYGIFSYEDRNGILHLGYANTKQLSKPIAIFSNPTDCREFLKKACQEFVLCPKYCQLVPSNTSKTNCFTLNCLAEEACQSVPKNQNYNDRVQQVIAALEEPKAIQVLKQKGRTLEEEAFVFVENGEYRGYGFVQTDLTITSIEDLKSFLIPQKNTIETQRIVNHAILRQENVLSVT